MKIIKELGTFEVDYFDDKIYDADGDAVTDYTMISPSSATGTVDTKFIVSGVALLNISKGDVVDITGEDGIVEDYIVMAVGTDVIRLQENLNASIGATVTVVTKKYSITAGALMVEGQYQLSTNEVIVIANTFSSAYINKSFLQYRYSNLSDNIDIDLANEDAKEALIADFPLNPLFYKTLDLGQITELMKRKILSTLELADPDRDSNNQPLTDNFILLLGETVNILDTVDDNTPSGDVTDETTLPSAGSVTWFPRV